MTLGLLRGAKQIQNLKLQTTLQPNNELTSAERSKWKQETLAENLR